MTFESGITASAETEEPPRQGVSGAELVLRREALRAEIKKIVGLPSEADRFRYAFLESKSKGFHGSEHLGDLETEEILDILDPVLREEEVKDVSAESALNQLLTGDIRGRQRFLIEAIEAWVASAPTKKDIHERIEKLESDIAETIERGRAPMSLSLISLLSEIGKHRQGVGVSKVLATTLERSQDALPSKIIDQIAVLSRMNDAQANLFLHKIVDFFESDLWTLQNIPPPEEEVDEYGNSYCEFAVRFSDFAGEESKQSKNYLIGKHFQGMYEMVHPYQGKNGSIEGIAGGSSDETIYQFRHLQESYDLRLALGIREGYPLAQPVLPVAPGFFGMYHDGRLSKIFPIPANFSIERAREKEQGRKSKGLLLTIIPRMIISMRR